jgi:hypothetical protein
MFRTQVDGDPSFVSWLAQQFTAALVPLLWALLARFPTELRHALGPTLGAVAAVTWNVIAVWTVGFVLGVLVQRGFPRAVRVGRFVWILPTVFFVICFLADCTNRPFPTVFADFFWPGSNGEAWWGVILVTFPTWSSICYSIGIIFTAKRLTVTDDVL